MNTELNALQKNISFQTIVVTNKIIESIDKHTKDFNKNEFFSFSDTSKIISEKYFSFLAEISPLVSELNSLNSGLASLLIKADKTMDIDLIILCENKFNAFEKFEISLYEYTSSIEKAIETSKATQIFFINATQKLKTALQNLIKENI